MSSPSPPPQFNAFNDALNTPSPPAYAFNTRVMVGAIVVLFFVIFFILMLHVYARWFLQRSSSSYFVSRRTTFSSLAGAAASAHTNTGLDKTFIAQLPTFVYTALTSPLHNLEAGKLAESVARPSSECSVCLSEFQENEKVRMLPSCKHIFHTECIDMWFFSHSTCPLCRTKVGPATATSASTDPQHQGQEAMENSPGTAEGNPVGSQAVEYPCNVLFWGNSAQVVSSQEPSSSSLPLPSSLRMPGARSVPQITIDIPPIEGNLPVSASSGSLSAKGKMEQEASSSQAIKSPGLRASIKRMLSRQSSRHKTSGQEGCAESPK